ncbi:hypothetical protein LEP1GSC013_3104 [Leptospira interrogans serovar Valbuzzi str. Duyster]|nr:hypothetical protein LEP1GSC013_3104 [Leptospira interrogans serovar Valbuzzi str. Duyster]ENO71926.1 hypothetical protein LEP1GSC012_2387 [Leptospira interrogans serovar Valbuzzi str. Valbuzzi]
MINTFLSETWNEALSELRAAMVAVLPPNRRKLPNLEVRLVQPPTRFLQIVFQLRLYK